MTELKLFEVARDPGFACFRKRIFVGYLSQHRIQISHLTLHVSFERIFKIDGNTAAKSGKETGAELFVNLQTIFFHRLQWSLNCIPVDALRSLRIVATRLTSTCD